MTFSDALLHYRKTKDLRYEVIQVYKNDRSEEAHMVRCAIAQAVYLSKLECAKQYHGPHFDEIWKRFQKANNELFTHSYSNRRHTRTFIKENIKLNIMRDDAERDVFLGL